MVVICEVDRCPFKSLQKSFSLESAALQSLVIFSASSWNGIPYVLNDNFH